MKEQFLKTMFVCGIGLTFMLSCSRRITPSATSYYTYQTECVGSELDGSQTLKAYGLGNTRGDATEQAKKNAIRDVLFKGNFTGSRECQYRPLLMEVNAAEKYATYFNVFFRDRGAYTQYVSLRDERFVERINRAPVTGNRDQDMYSAVVRVQREELRQLLIRDGILNQ